ncbi:MAG: ABC transporter permease [Bacteroidota bacterium]|nr:ABC transporter permease [Bacteroidota bacterium]
MLKYILKRILIFLPTLIVVTLLGFVISLNAPGDPVERMVSAAQSGGAMGTQTANLQQAKKEWREKLGLDLPVFYFSLTSLSRPDTLYKIYDKGERVALDRLISSNGNWKEIQEYYKSLCGFYESQINFIPDTNVTKGFDRNQVLETLNQIKFESSALKSTYEEKILEAKFKKVEILLSTFPFLSTFRQSFQDVQSNFQAIKTNASKWKNYIPKLDFYGENQYHRWVFGDGGIFSKGLWRGDFGISYVTKQPVSEVISERIFWSLLFALLSVLLAYFVSIPLGVKAAANRGGRFDKTSSIILFMLYSMPSFWLATLLMMTFSNTDVFHVFPASGVKPASGYPEGASFGEMVMISLPYCILPLICYTYSSFAFLSRTMRVSMIEIVGQDYIRTARAKGLTEKTVIWKHGFRNALLPIITVFANIFPAAIGGSVILESIFTIPGMGSEAISAIQNNNYPMIIAIMTITSFLTLVGFLISDILYAVVDPRISYK